RLDSFRQVTAVAAAQGQCIINAGYTYDRELFEKLGQMFPDLDVAPFSATDLPEHFEVLSVQERNAAGELMYAAERALAPFEVSADAKKFFPKDLPALFVESEGADFLRELERTQEESEGVY